MSKRTEWKKTMNEVHAIMDTLTAAIERARQDAYSRLHNLRALSYEELDNIDYAFDVMKDEVKRLENQIECMVQEARAKATA